MLTIQIFGIFFLIALAGLPLYFSLIATTVGIVQFKNLFYQFDSLFLNLIAGVEPFILIAVPLFIFAGELLARGGVGKRIVALARVLFGWMPGGMGVVTIVSCLMFGGVSGSAIADTAAIGSLVAPTMKERGYHPDFTAALLSVAGTLALLMPLSIPFLVFAFVSGVSMRILSMSGVVPGIICAVALSIVCVRYGKKTGCDNGSERASPREIWRVAKEAGPALLMPVIIVGGIWSGMFTPTEAASIAVVYGLAISLFLYKDIKARDLPAIILKAFQTSASVLLVIGATGVLSWLLTAEMVAFELAEWIQSVASQPWQFLLMLNIALLLLGIFIEPLPAMLLTAPLFLPMAQAMNIDMILMGVIMVMNLSIALYTPPVGGTLFVAAKLCKASIGGMSRHIIPLMVMNVSVLFITTYVPWLSKILPKLLFGVG
ncbi:MAG: TRAP transporter large permease [Candidatus Accumulibacter sp.]|jgi:C4-dicarboxylate transporter DctM subunit|nr:TRAP transporter large permease [Accumulibacter sp.]